MPFGLARRRDELPIPGARVQHAARLELRPQRFGIGDDEPEVRRARLPRRVADEVLALEPLELAQVHGEVFAEKLLFDEHLGHARLTPLTP